jgi:hypothetical protein
LSKALPVGKHSFTAFATEKSGLGNAEGKSSTVSFEVNTEPPVVTLVGPPSPSNNQTPAFSGTASENTEVVVHVLEGSTEVASATTTASGGKWSTSTLSKALPSGKRSFTAFATEKSGLGNAEGKSSTVSFEVNTEPPVVTIVGPPTRSNNQTPAFSGTASENTEVVVHVLEGSTEVASATTTASGGKWSTSTLSKALAAGTRVFTAFATEVSGLGNANGKSTTVSFEVNTEPPVVTLERPAAVSNNTTPAFSGTASESLPVTVEVFQGAKAEGKAIAKLVAGVSGGHWSSAHLTTELKSGQYTAIASEPSSLENPTGKSEPATFEVDTNAPNVTVKAPPPSSNNTSPSFSGTVSGPAGETVTVYVYEGSSTLGSIVRTVTATVSHTGTWASPAVAPPLPGGTHTFTVVATAPSSIVGNRTGESAPATFVVNTEPPAVTLNQPTPLSNDATPSFSGTASESTAVEVVIYRGATAEGTPVVSTTAIPSGGRWATHALGQHLEDGQYTAIATENSAIGNAPGRSAPASFTVDTRPPTVTLNGIPSPSSDRVPSFSGSASDHTPVTVKIYQGATTNGSLVASMEAQVSDGEWFSGAVSTLEWGEYTAVATEPSSLGNPQGVSSSVTFVVERIAPRVVTEEAAGVTSTTATLHAAVNPVGGPISACNIDVGPTTSYGRSVGCGFVSGASAFPRIGVSFVPVFIRIYGLRPSTTYHYRAVAVGEGGTGAGPDKTFVTPESTNPPREAEHPSTPPARVGVAGLFAARLIPGGRAARIGAILANGFFKQSFTAPEAGRAVIKWYYLPPGAKLARKPAPVLVAAGTVSFHAAGRATVKLRLTGAGRRLLRHSKRTRLTLTCGFQPAGGAAVTTSGSFELHR